MNTAIRRIKATIRKRHLTDAAFARELGISKSHLSLILRGKRRPSLRLALRLEEKTGVSVRDLAKVA